MQRGSALETRQENENQIHSMLLVREHDLTHRPRKEREKKTIAAGELSITAQPRHLQIQSIRITK
jgi:hypothetical protein